MLVEAKLFSVCLTAWNKLTTYHYIKRSLFNVFSAASGRNVPKRKAKCYVCIRKKYQYMIFYLQTVHIENSLLAKYKLIISGGILSVSL